MKKHQLLRLLEFWLARNLENHVHPLMYATENDGFRVINEVQDALPNFELMRLDQMDQQSKMKMVAKHLISPELIKQTSSRSISE